MSYCRTALVSLAAGCLCLSTPLPAQTGSTFVNTLLPEPSTLTAGAGGMPLTPAFSVSEPNYHDARLDDAVERMLQQLERKTGLSFTRDALTSGSASLTLAVQGPGEAVQSVDEDESYTLEVTPAGAKIGANTVVGAMRGMTTLLQLVQANGSGYFLPAVQIADAPRFRWRGLMIDSSRHFEPVDGIERTLDGMAAVKMNVLHWHLSDDQGFRMESRVFPKLQRMGSDGQFYTQAQVKEVIAYARARGIRIVPEFDMPGHSNSWFLGYPELAGAPGPYQIRAPFGAHDEPSITRNIPSKAMDPTRQSTYKFLDKFVGEMAGIFPDPYFHIGGDEVAASQWSGNAKIQAFMQAHNMPNAAALQVYFNQRLLKILKKHGKVMIGWDEILTPGLPKDIVVQSWRGQASLAEGAREGYQGILSAPYYLDHLDSAAQHYLADPLPSSLDLTPAQRALILGGEACMWAEHIDAWTIDGRIWPRTAAIAERFWSPENVRNVDDMYRRLSVESVRLEALGLTQISQRDASLRQMTGQEDIGALRVFASVLRPTLNNYQAPIFAPLDRMADAVPPDPPSRHRMNLLVREYLKSPQTATQQRDALTAAFLSWIGAMPKVEAQMKDSPILASMQPRLQQLPDLATAGLEAVAYLSSGNRAPAGWSQSKLALVDAAANPATLPQFTFLDALRQLITAVPEQ